MSRSTQQSPGVPVSFTVNNYLSQGAAKALSKVAIPMNSEYLTFKIFPDKVSAEDFSEVLKLAGIDYYIEEDALVFDASYANNPLSKDYAIKVRHSDFKSAGKAYDDYFAGQVGQAPPEHYLFNFSDEELLEVLARPDEWGPFDYQLSKEILRQRGIEVSDHKIAILKAERYKQLAKPESESVSNIAAYYIISIIFFPVGIIIGWTWGYSKKQLPDGYKVYAYNEKVRSHGRTIFLISIGIFFYLVISTIMKSR
jgi:hypothetical protein